MSPSGRKQTVRFINFRLFERLPSGKAAIQRFCRRSSGSTCKDFFYDDFQG